MACPTTDGMGMAQKQASLPCSSKMDTHWLNKIGQHRGVGSFVNFDELFSSW